MPFLDHLEELRRRVLVSLLAILVVTAVALIFSDSILKLLLVPAGGMKLNAFSLMDGFLIKFRIALYLGVAAAFPIWGYEIYQFIAPGLMDKERRALLPGLLASLGLFILGVAFGYFLLREMIKVLIALFPSEVSFLPAADDYISFVTFFLLACGVAFQLPVVLVLLVEMRILKVDTMKKQRKIAYFALFVFAEIVTPVTDPIVAPMVVMVPLLILYEASILVGGRIEARRRREAKSQEIVG